MKKIIVASIFAIGAAISIVSAQDGGPDPNPGPRFTPFFYQQLDTNHGIRIVKDNKTTQCFVLVETFFASSAMPWAC